MITRQFALFRHSYYVTCETKLKPTINTTTTGVNTRSLCNGLAGGLLDNSPCLDIAIMLHVLDKTETHNQYYNDRCKHARRTIIV